MFKREIKRLAAIFGMAVIVVLILLYRDGWYDISFIDRAYLNDTEHNYGYNNSPVGIDDMTSGGNDIQTVESESAQSGESVSGESGENQESNSGDDIISVPENKFKFESAEELQKNGYAKTDTTYENDTHILAEVAPKFDIPDKFSDTMRTEYDMVKVYDTPESEYRIEYVSRETERPLMEPYMGYILYNEGYLIHVLTSDGYGILSYDIEDYYPAYTRDTQNRPLFYKNVVENINGTDCIVTKYYYIDVQNHAFVESDYIDARDNRGLYFDYPASYGISDSELKRFAELTPTITTDASGRTFMNQTATYAFAREDSGWLYYRYNFATPYSNGLAVTADQYNFVQLINEYGTPVMGTRQTYRNHIRVTEMKGFVMPATRGVESLGFFYFDHGLTRVREQAFDYYEYSWRRNKLMVHDIDMLVYADGTVFDLPYGYNLVAYSDGVALLEKDGKYGYFDYRQKWIIQPIYSYAEPFFEGLAVVGYANGVKGVINTDGEFVVPLKYSYISNCSSGVMTAYNSVEDWKIINKMAK